MADMNSGVGLLMLKEQKMLTIFERQPGPLTLREWDYAALHRLPRACGWERFARETAQQVGGAHVLKADDTLVVFTRLSSGKVRKTTYKPGTWVMERDVK